MAGVTAFGTLRFNTIEPDELAQAIGGWMKHCLTPEGEKEAPAARNITLKLAGILGPTNLTSLTTIVKGAPCPKWQVWTEKLASRCVSETRCVN